MQFITAEHEMLLGIYKLLSIFSFYPYVIMCNSECCVNGGLTNIGHTNQHPTM